MDDKTSNDETTTATLLTHEQRFEAGVIAEDPTVISERIFDADEDDPPSIGECMLAIRLWREAADKMEKLLSGAS